MLTAPGCLPAIGADDVPAALLRSVRHVHAASYFLLPRLAAGLAVLFEEADKATTSLDPNDDPADRWDRITLDPVLRRTDYLFPNAAEARALTGHPSATEAAGILARHGPLVVLKNGASGALAHDGSKVLTATPPDVDPVDAVGAGDSFDAGFVAAILNGHDHQRALEIATACGSLSTRAAGGTTAQPDWQLATEQAADRTCLSRPRS